MGRRTAAGMSSDSTDPGPWRGEGALAPLSGVPKGAPAAVVPLDIEPTEPFEAALRDTTPWGTALIVAVCAGIFAWEIAAGGSANPAVLIRVGALDPEWEWWRLLSCAFVHFGVLHFAVNLLALWSVAPLCERMYGNWRFLAMYCVSALMTSLVSQYFVHEVSGGASGAIFGLCGATAILAHRLRGRIPESLRRTLMGRLVPIVALNLIVGLAVGPVGNLLPGNAGHLAGLLGGAAFALVVPGRMELPQPRWVTMLTPLFIGLALLPFAVEGWLVWQAVVPPNYAASTPARYRGAGLEFDYPSALRVASKSNNTVELHASGLLVQVAQVDTDSEGAMNDDIAESARHAGLQPKGRAEAVEFGGRPWVITNGSMEGGSDGTLALGRRGKVVVSVLLVYDRGFATQAESIAKLICGSLTVAR